jgi:hypothetical protein
MAPGIHFASSRYLAVGYPTDTGFNRPAIHYGDTGVSLGLRSALRAVQREASMSFAEDGMSEADWWIKRL